MRDPRLAPFRSPLAAFALFLALQAASGAALFAGKVGPGAARIATYYRGSADGFRPPPTLAGLLEVAVPHLVAIPLVLFVALHLLGLASAVRRRPLSLLAGLGFGCALLGVGAAFGIRFLWPGLAWAKIGAFVGLEVSIAVQLGLLATLFLPGRRARAGGSAATGAPGRATAPVMASADRGGSGRAATATPAPGFEP
jgi:hypothetical protein